MKFFILTSLLSVLLMAQEAANPKVFTALGDEIYNNISPIEKLKTLSQYKTHADKIDTYISNVSKTKILGYKLESGKNSNVKLDYLSQLRDHKKTNDYFLRSAHSAFKSALDTQDSTLFIGTVNSGLVDTKANRKKIMNYYNVHKQDINPQGIIQTFIDEDEAWKNRKRWKPKTKKQLQKEKIARLRKNDILNNEALEKKLSKELKAKKEKIRKEQERELFN